MKKSRHVRILKIYISLNRKFPVQTFETYNLNKRNAVKGMQYIVKGMQ